MSFVVRRGLAWACAVFLGLYGSAVAQTPVADPVHVGVQSCAGSTCHGAVQPVAGARVQQNEYFIWSQKDKHAKAYAVLREPRSLQIAKNLGLPDAEHATLCLDCHTDNVPEAKRGPQFQLSDGIGCEACHGGALPWLGSHVSGADHKANVAAGMFPTDQPLARAERCLSCHLGNDQKFVVHKIMGAGHPPTPFELDTYTAIEPAHYTITPSYVQRKGRPNDMQFWAAGQAVDVKLRMDLILDQKNAPKGLDFELSLFDCQACHHSMNELQWRARATTGLPPGRIKLYDATMVMLNVAAARVAPDSAKALRDHMLALHKAVYENWDAVKREATAVRDAANTLIPQLAKHDFTKDDAKAMANAVIASALQDGDFDYSGAQQQVMALGSIVAAMKLLGFADQQQLAGLNDALNALYTAVADDQKYAPDTYATALNAFKAKL
jgi:cytochrome c554/c'-like protein